MLRHKYTSILTLGALSSFPIGAATPNAVLPASGHVPRGPFTAAKGRKYTQKWRNPPFLRPVVDAGASAR